MFDWILVIFVYFVGLGATLGFLIERRQRKLKRLEQSDDPILPTERYFGAEVEFLSVIWPITCAIYIGMTGYWLLRRLVDWAVSDRPKRKAIDEDLNQSLNRLIEELDRINSTEEEEVEEKSELEGEYKITLDEAAQALDETTTPPVSMEDIEDREVYSNLREE